LNGKAEVRRQKSDLFMAKGGWRRRPVGASAPLRDWLLNRGLLTRRIEERCKNFSVRLLFQGAGRTGLDERAPGSSQARLVLVREVSLRCGNTPVVFAHSVAQLRHLRGPWRALSTLGSRPLGAALFENPRVRRHPMRFRKLASRHALHQEATRVAGRPLPPLWARRTLYTLRRAPILVTEVFLPALLR
jgi:chorismate--pyruvate lyase